MWLLCPLQGRGVSSEACAGTGVSLLWLGLPRLFRKYAPCAAVSGPRDGLPSSGHRCWARPGRLLSCAKASRKTPAGKGLGVPQTQSHHQGCPF